MRRRPSSSRIVSIFLATGLAVLLAVVSGARAGASRESGPGPPAAARTGATVDVSVSVTDKLRFVPNALEVSPGTTIALTVTQLGTTAHTFTLSPVANYSLSTSVSLFAFFSAHPPIVNLSIPNPTGSTVRATFAAPAAGYYEYV